MESPPKWYKRLKFLDSDSDKKSIAIHDCDLICAYVNDQKFLFHIGTIIPMLLTKALQSTNLFLVFVIPLFLQECKCPSIFCI